ncbi:MAG TPA: hypothetical protein VGK52_13740 [Polyangia bacterium]
MIPHSGPPSQTLPIELVTSGSKSHFGVTKWKVKDQTGAPGCVAVGLLGLTNLNLNCGTPAPTPFGLVIAPTTHLATLTLGDLVSGLYMMAWDYMAQRILYMAGKFAGDAVAKLINNVAGRLGVGLLGRTAARQLARAMGIRSEIGPVARALRAARARTLTTVADRTMIALGLAAGSPLGISTSTIPGGETKSGYDRLSEAVDPQARGDALGQAVDDYFNSPAVQDVPPAPDDGAEGVGGSDSTVGPSGSDGGDAGQDTGGSSSDPDSGAPPSDATSSEGQDVSPDGGAAGGNETNMSTPDDGTNTSSDPGPTSSDPGPTSSDPGPTSSDPGPTSSDPGPTSSDPGPTSSDAGPTSSEPAPPDGDQSKSSPDSTPSADSDGNEPDGGGSR